MPLHEDDNLTIILENGVEMDLRQADYDDLIAIEYELASAIANIESQLEAARLDQELYGVTPDRQWERSARFAMQMKKNARQLVQRYMGLLKRRERQARQIRMEKCFIDICKLRLDRMIFNEILQEAHDRSDQNMQEIHEDHAL